MTKQAGSGCREGDHARVTLNSWLAAVAKRRPGVEVTSGLFPRFLSAAHTVAMEGVTAGSAAEGSGAPTCGWLACCIGSAAPASSHLQGSMACAWSTSVKQLHAARWCVQRVHAEDGCSMLHKSVSRKLMHVCWRWNGRVLQLHQSEHGTYETRQGVYPRTLMVLCLV